MMKRKRSKEQDADTRTEGDVVEEPSSATSEEGDVEETSAEAEAPTPEQELAEYRDRYQRTLAEQENARKRHQREMSDARQYAIADFARDLLEVVDNLSRAIDGIPDDQTDDPLASGVRLVQDQLLKALKNHGVTEVEAIGAPFDPMFHNAVMEDERGDIAPGIVTEELVKGYQVRDRLLRAAMVKVSKAPSAANQAEEEEE